MTLAHTCLYLASIFPAVEREPIVERIEPQRVGIVEQLEHTIRLLREAAKADGEREAAKRTFEEVGP